jgi:acid phosphatase (class A)
MVCNVHWMSDTEAGMAVGAAAFARLQNNELFQATMTAARAELSSASVSAPDPDACEQEAATLALSN